MNEDEDNLATHQREVLEVVNRNENLRADRRALAASAMGSRTSIVDSSSRGIAQRHQEKPPPQNLLNLAIIK